MESLLDPSSGLRVVAAHYTGAYFPLIVSSHFQLNVQSHHVFSVITFRFVSLSWTFIDISSQLGDQSHHLITVWRSESLFPLGIQSRCFRLAFIAIVLAWHLESPHHLLIGLSVQSHYLFLSFGVQSHHLFSILAFKATIPSHFQRSELFFVYSSTFIAIVPLFQFGIQSCIFILAFKATETFQFGIQNHHLFFDLAFRAASSFWCLEPLFASSSSFIAIIPLFQFGVQSRIFILAFRAVVCFLFDIQSHHLFFPFDVQSCIFISTFKTISSVWHSEPLFVFGSTFRAVFSVWRSESLFILVRHSEPHLQFSVQNSILCLASRVIVHFQFGVQGRRLFFLVRRSESSCLSSIRRSESHLHLGVQSHISSQAFKPASSVWSSESCHQFNIQSHYSLLTFRSIVSFGVQCHHLSLVLAFRAIMHTH